MEKLPETRNAIMQILSDERMRSGVHLADYITVGVPGVSVGEVPFNPQMHSVAAIDPMSVNEWLDGMPQVRQVVPFRPLEVNVVLHKDPANKQRMRSRQREWLAPALRHKEELALDIADAVFEAKQFGDDSNFYVVGDITEQVDSGWKNQYIEGTEKPEDAARFIEDICLRGLTFVVGDFARLPLQENAGINRSIAIKSNHPYELQVPKAKYALPIGGDQEVRLWKDKERDQYNHLLNETNQAVLDRLSSIGMRVVAHAAASSEQVRYDTDRVDIDLAASLRNIQQS